MDITVKSIKETIQRKLERLEKGTLIQKFVVRNELEHDLELIENLEKEIQRKIEHYQKLFEGRFDPEYETVLDVLREILGDEGEDCDLY